MISFSGATLLDYSHSNLYLGDIFRYATRKNLTIEGNLYALGNESGVAPIWAGISGFVTGAVDYSSIVINGVNFGRGQIDNISFSEGKDVTRKGYSAAITIIDSGNLFNLTGQYYSGLDFGNVNNPVELIDSFSEDFSFDINIGEGGEYSQTVNLRFVSGAAITGGNINPILMAKTFASGLLFSNPGFYILSDQYDGFYGLEQKKYYTEVYNQITNECSFTATSNIVRKSGCYGFTYTHSLNIDENGIGTTSESANIRGICNAPYQNAQSGYNTEIGNSYGRCSGVYYAYLSGNLSNNPVSITRSNDIFRGTIDYEITYSDNPSLYNTYSWEYSHTIDTSSPCIYSVSEEGKIIGRSLDCGGTDSYTNAQNAWNSIKTGVSGRSYNFYNQATHQTKSLRPVSAEISNNQFGNSIDYNYVYSDDANFSISGFKKIEQSVSDNFPVHLINKFNILGVKELVQPGYMSTEGQRDVELTINGYKHTELTGYLSFAKDYLNNLKPTGGDVFIKATKYSYSPTEHQFNIQVSWDFFGSRAFSNIVV